MSSDSENNSEGDLDDLDDILAALDPMHGSKPVVRDETKSKTTMKVTSPPPLARKIISPQEEDMTESASAKVKLIQCHLSLLGT